MYPSIGHLVNDLFGANIAFLYVIKSFGFFVAMAFLLASYFLARDLKRKEEEGLMQAQTRKVLKGKPASAYQLAVSGLVGFVIGWKLLHIALNFSDFVDSPHIMIFSLEGNIIGGVILGCLLSYLKYREKEKQKSDEPKWVEETIRPHQHVGNITLLAALFGILGAKAFHLLENPDEISSAFDSAEGFFSGLTMYGGLIFGAAAVLIYAKRNGLTVFGTMDANAPGLMLAYGVGRIGCQMAGDGDWGIDNLSPMPGWLNFLPEWFWAYNYPHNVISSGIPIADCTGQYCRVLANPVFPTPLYEAMVCIGLFFLLWLVRKKITTAGVMFSSYLILNGIERFFIEKIRVNETISLMGMEVTQAEIIAVILILAGGFGIWFLRKHRDKVAKI